MEILFTKNSKEVHIQSCKRNDGTVTWKQISPFFIIHDLCHFAVETTLPLQNAFFGMVSKGINISDFDLPKEQRNFELTDEAIFAEQLVNLLTIECTQGRMDNMLEIISDIYKESNRTMGVLPITNEKLEQVRLSLADQLQHWKLLSELQTMKLSFED